MMVPCSLCAHSGYVLPPEVLERALGADMAFWTRALSDPVNLAVLAGGALLACVIVISAPRIALARSAGVWLAERMARLERFVPLLVRLGLGIALVGAGLDGAFLSPVLPDYPSLVVPQIVVGAFLIIGLFTFPAAIAAALLFLGALAAHPYFLSNLDLLALALALVFLRGSPQGLDARLGIRFLAPRPEALPRALFLLRMGIGAVLIYLAIYEQFLNPRVSLVVVEEFHLTSVIPVNPALWVLAAGLTRLLFGTLFLAGVFVRLVSLATLAIVISAFVYFGEGLYPHATLVAILLALIIGGGGRWQGGNGEADPAVQDTRYGERDILAL